MQKTRDVKVGQLIKQNNSFDLLARNHPTTGGFFKSLPVTPTIAVGGVVLGGALLFKGIIGTALLGLCAYGAYSVLNSNLKKSYKYGFVAALAYVGLFVF